jgi:hypothetical protein
VLALELPDYRLARRRIHGSSLGSYVLAHSSASRTTLLSMRRSSGTAGASLLAAVFVPLFTLGGDRPKLGLAVAVEVLALFAQQAPERLEAVSLRWVRRYATEARGQRLEDYRRIVTALAMMRREAEFATDELLRLCEEEDSDEAGPARWSS